jgi:4-amino-4-deoxy-L-arabinose transferase-like glycosyltransferase
MAAYALVVWTYVGAYAGGADQSGYLNAARLFAQREVSAPVRSIPGLPRDGMSSWAYSPLGFNPRGADAIVPSYPIGLPLIVVAASPFIGLDAAANGVMVVFTLAGVLLTVWLARECGLSRWGSLLAGLILATSPLYLHMSLQLMSDTPALVWVTAAMLFAWRSRRSPAWAAGAGLACGMAVLTRPANVLVIVPIAICLGVSLRRWAYLGAGGLPGAVLLFWVNLAAYGSALTTGYGDSRALFQFANVEPSLLNYVTWLPVELTPIGVLGLAMPVLIPRSARTVAALAAWILVFLVFYAFYFHTHEVWWYLRFLLPAFPAMIVGSLLVGRAALARATATSRAWTSPAARVTAGALLVALVLVHNAWWSRRLHALNVGQDQRDYVEAAAWMQRRLPAGAVILAMQVSGSFLYYTNFPILRYDYLDGEPAQRVLALWPEHPLYAVLFPFEVEQGRIFRNHLPGRWEQIGAVKHITVWEYRGPQAAESQ